MKLNERWYHLDNKRGYWVDDNNKQHIIKYSDANKEDYFNKQLELRGPRAMWAYKHGFEPTVVKRGEDLGDDEISQWRSRARYFGDESYYGNKYFYIKLPDVNKPILALIRVSNHPIDISTWYSNQSSGNITGIGCDTCFDIIIGYQKRDNNKGIKVKQRINDIQVFFDPTKTTDEQNEAIDNFIDSVKNGDAPIYSIEDLERIFGSKIYIKTYGNGNMRDNQYQIPKLKHRKKSLELPQWTNTNGGYPHKINYNDTEEISDFKANGITYKIFNYNGTNYLSDLEKEDDGYAIAYPISNKGKILTDKPISLMIEHKLSNVKKIHLKESQYNNLIKSLL